MDKEINSLTLTESKILELGKKQFDKGYQGGNFTPGFIRKETEYGYRAINVALESLIASELVEKTVTSTFRNGSVVELDVYKITDSGIQVFEKLQAGSISITGKEPPKQSNTPPEPKPYQKQWDSPSPRYEERPRYDSKPRYESRPAPGPEYGQTIKAMEITIRAMSEEMRLLKSKIERLESKMAQPAPQPIPQPASQPSPAQEPPKPKRSMDSDMMRHRALLVKAVSELSVKKRNVLAEDVKDRYFAECEIAGMKPKGASQFTPFLKRLEADGLLSLKRMGCKNLGIKGQGSRVVVKATDAGIALLQQ